jgi:hypothetical protein
MGSPKVLAFVSILLVCVLTGPALYAQTPERDSQPRTDLPSEPSSSIICSAEQPTVSFNGSVHVRVWRKPEGSDTVEPVWTVTAGTVQGHGNEIVWSLNGVVHEGIYHAQAKISNNSLCSVRVVVVDPTRRESVAHETGRSFLLKGKPEAEGYGLYSYLLLGSRSTPATRDRYLKVVTAYMQRIEKISSLEEYIPRVKLNITYLPVEVPLSANATASWLLDHYDYSRARVLLDLLPGERKDGIYLISTLKPLAKSNIPPYLFQDLSAVPTSPDDLISWWVGEFLSQAAQEQFWQPRTGELFALKLRTTLAVLGSGLPEVQQALKSWIEWTTAPSRLDIVQRCNCEFRCNATPDLVTF